MYNNDNNNNNNRNYHSEDKTNTDSSDQDSVESSINVEKDHANNEYSASEKSKLDGNYWKVDIEDTRSRKRNYTLRDRAVVRRETFNISELGGKGGTYQGERELSSLLLPPSLPSTLNPAPPNL